MGVHERITHGFDGMGASVGPMSLDEGLVLRCSRFDNSQKLYVLERGERYHCLSEYPQIFSGLQYLFLFSRSE